jgi:hypothetical protein
MQLSELRHCIKRLREAAKRERQHDVAAGPVFESQAPAARLRPPSRKNVIPGVGIGKTARGQTAPICQLNRLVFLIDRHQNRTCKRHVVWQNNDDAHPGGCIFAGRTAKRDFSNRSLPLYLQRLRDFTTRRATRRVVDAPAAHHPIAETRGCRLWLRTDRPRLRRWLRCGSGGSSRRDGRRR